MTDALAELCAERGYRAITMGHIAARARIGKRMVYELFDNKGEIFLALVRRVSDEVIDLVERHCANPPDDGVDSVAVGLQTILHWVRGNPDLAWALLVEAPAGPAGAAQVYLELFEFFGERLHTADRRGLERSEPATELLVGGVASILRNALVGGNADRAPAMFEGLMDFLDPPKPVRSSTP